MRVVTREILGEAGGRRSPGDGCRSYARCGGQHDGLSGLQSQRKDSRFFAKNVIGGSDWPLRCQTPAVRRSLHVKPGSQRNPRNDFRRLLSATPEFSDSQPWGTPRCRCPPRQPPRDTQSRFGKHEIRLRGDGGVRVVKQDSQGPSRPVRLNDNRRMGDTCREAWSFAFCTVLFESENSRCGSSRCCCLLL